MLVARFLSTDQPPETTEAIAQGLELEPTTVYTDRQPPVRFVLIPTYAGNQTIHYRTRLSATASTTPAAAICVS